MLPGSPGLKGFVAPVEQRLGARDETTEVPWVDLHAPAIVATTSGTTLERGEAEPERRDGVRQKLPDVGRLAMQRERAGLRERQRAQVIDEP